MITRRHVRIRVVQTYYSTLINSVQQDHAVELLTNVLHQAYQLLYIEISLLMKILKIIDFKTEKISQSKTPSNPLLNQYSALGKNPFLRFISQHSQLNQIIISNNIHFWNQHNKTIENLIEKLLNSQPFNDYITFQNPSEDQHRKLLIYLFTDIIAGSENLQEIYQDYSMSFTDDLPLVNTYLLKSIKRMKLNDSSSLIISIPSDQTRDIRFAKALLKKTFVHREQIVKHYNESVKNWAIDRLATLDTAILNVSIAELLYFPEIPKKVTINEYVDIAKDYSTEKSGMFINGILDSLMKKYLN